MASHPQSTNISADDGGVLMKAASAEFALKENEYTLFMSSILKVQ